MKDLLIKGGTVVDGTGAPAFKADVLVKDGRIARVGTDLAANGAEIHDAAGCYVTPGFIESHTHYDATMWWQNDLDPLPGYGATTIITGNCGFTAAPISDDKAAQIEMMNIFSFFEDIPLEPFAKEVPWDWRLWSEYKESLKKRVQLPLNNASFVGHIAIRLAAMGVDAWKRAATRGEIARMAELLDDALAAGALGLSENLLDHDGEGRPIPTLLAEDEEISALFDVLDRYPHASVQCVLDIGLIRDTGPEQSRRLARLLKGRAIRFQFTGLIPTIGYQGYLLEPMRALRDEIRAMGIDAWVGYAHIPFTLQLGLYKTLLFAQSGDYVWHEVVKAETPEEKAALLADPDWRARARDSWETKSPPASPMNNPHMLLLTRIGSDNGTGPFDLTLKDYAEQKGVHRSDAMADWFLANGVYSTIRMEPFAMNDEAVVEMVHDERTVGNISDAGAHLQMLCGGGENIVYLTKYHRDEKLITIEEAVHVMTGRLAEHFRLRDIGEIKEGKRADIAVFNLAEIQQRDMEKAYDVTDGKGGITWRFTRQAAPMRLTLVNGVATFDGKKATGEKPGEFLEPAMGEFQFAAAAE